MQLMALVKEQAGAGIENVPMPRFQYPTDNWGQRLCDKHNLEYAQKIVDLNQKIAVALADIDKQDQARWKRLHITPPGPMLDYLSSGFAEDYMQDEA